MKDNIKRSQIRLNYGYQLANGKKII